MACLKLVFQMVTTNQKKKTKTAVCLITNDFVGCIVITKMHWITNISACSINTLYVSSRKDSETGFTVKCTEVQQVL